MPESNNGLPHDGPFFGEWKVGDLRLSVFHSSPSSRREGLWKALMGNDPSNTARNQADGTIAEHGNVHGNVLRLIVRPEKHDWNVQPDAARAEDGPPTLVSPYDTLDLLQRALAVSVAEVLNVQRLAFGATLIQRGSSLDDALKVIAKHLPGAQPDRDFVYRINRRRRSKNATHVEINRLATWGLGEFLGASVVMGPSVPLQLNPLAPAYLATLQLDINSVPGTSAVSSRTMPALFTELCSLASEIASKGDIP